MRALRAWLTRLAAPLTRSQWERDLDDELRAILELHIGDNLRSGMSDTEARRAARLRLGSVESVKEQYRDRRALPALSHLLRDASYAARSLTHARLFSASTVATLALCIAVNAVSFSVLYDRLLRPLPFDNAHRLVEVTTPDAARGPDTSAWSWSQYLDYREHADLFDGFAVTSAATLVVDQGDETVRRNGHLLTADFFDITGVEPLLGRFFTEDENVEGRSQVIVLPQRVWERRLR